MILVTSSFLMLSILIDVFNPLTFLALTLRYPSLLVCSCPFARRSLSWSLSVGRCVSCVHSRSSSILTRLQAWHAFPASLAYSSFSSLVSGFLTQLGWFKVLQDRIYQRESTSYRNGYIQELKVLSKFHCASKVAWLGIDRLEQAYFNSYNITIYICNALMDYHGLW